MPDFRERRCKRVGGEVRPLLQGDCGLSVRMAPNEPIELDLMLIGTISLDSLHDLEPGRGQNLAQVICVDRVFHDTLVSLGEPSNPKISARCCRRRGGGDSYT